MPPFPFPSLQHVPGRYNAIHIECGSNLRKSNFLIINVEVLCNILRNPIHKKGD